MIEVSNLSILDDAIFCNAITDRAVGRKCVVLKKERFVLDEYFDDFDRSVRRVPSIPVW